MAIVTIKPRPPTSRCSFQFMTFGSFVSTTLSDADCTRMAGAYDIFTPNINSATVTNTRPWTSTQRTNMRASNGCVFLGYLLRGSLASDAPGTGANHPADLYLRGATLKGASYNWQATTAYVLNDVTLPTVNNGHAYICVKAGTSAGSEPTWPTVRGATVVDASATWQEYEINGIYGDPSITAKGAGYWSMKIWDPRWWDFIEGEYALRFTNYAADGMLMDVMGASGVGDIGDPWNVPTPWNPFYRKIGWNAVENELWIKMSANMGAIVAATLGKDVTSGTAIPNFMNGIQDGPSYFDPSTPTSPLLNGIEGAMVELFVRNQGAGPTSWPTQTAVEQTIDMMIDAYNRGKVLICITKLWPSTGWTSLTIAQQVAYSKQWHAFSYAIFIVGNISDANGKSLHSFQYRDDNANDSAATQVEQNANPMKGRHHQFKEYYYSTTVMGDGTSRTVANGGVANDIWWDRINLGLPIDNWASAAAAKFGATTVYQRSFTNGLVLFNVGATGVSYTLPAGNYLNIDGVTYTGTITVAGHTGLILSKI